MTTALDGRLFVPALVSWAMAVVVILFGWRHGIVCAGIVLVTALIVGSVHSSARQALWATGFLAAAIGLSVAWCEAAVSSHWLTALESGADVRVTAEVRDDPKRVGGSVIVTADVEPGSTRIRVLAHGRDWQALIPGDVIEVRGTIAPPMRRDLTAATVRAREPPTLVRPAPAYQQFASTIRDRFREAAAIALPADAAGLLPALVVGDTSALPGDVEDDMKAAGLAHLSAVSGANFAILLASVLALTRSCSLSPRWTAVVCIVALGFFVVLARPSPSVVRAAVMGAVGVLALVVGRPKQALPALGAAIVVLIAIDPSLAVSAGFLLSVIATAGLILIAPSWSAWLQEKGLPRLLAEVLAMAVSAYVVTLPVVVGLSGAVSLVSVVANVLVAAVIAPLTVLGAVGALTAVVFQPIAVLAIRLTGPPLWWLLNVARSAAAVPWASIPVREGPGAAVIASVVVVLLIIGLRFQLVRKVGFVSLLGCLAGVVVAHATINL